MKREKLGAPSFHLLIGRWQLNRWIGLQIFCFYLAVHQTAMAEGVEAIYRVQDPLQLFKEKVRAISIHREFERPYKDDLARVQTYKKKGTKRLHEFVWERRKNNAQNKEHGGKCQYHAQPEASHDLSRELGNFLSYTAPCISSKNVPDCTMMLIVTGVI